MSDNNPVFDQELIFRRGENWDQEWAKVLYYLFVSPGVLRQKVNALRWDKQFEQNRDEFVNSLYLLYRLKPDVVLKTFDPQRGDLLYWLTSVYALRFRWKNFIRKKRSGALSLDELGLDVADSSDAYGLSVREDLLSEDKIIGELISNLNVYSQQNSSSRLTEQAALQNFCKFSPESGQGINRICQELLEVVAPLNPDVSAEKLIQELHAKAQKKYQQRHDEYTLKTSDRGKSTEFYQKYERKIERNYYLRLFCPIRDVNDLKRLLNFSPDNAYKRPSEYRIQLLPELLPSYREKLEDIENWKE